MLHGMLPLLMLALADPSAPRHFVNSREIILSIDAQSGTLAPARAWISHDDGQNWRLADARRVGDGALAARVPGDGRYAFILAQPSESNQLGVAPESGQPPQVFVTVDTAAPTLQIRSIAAHLAGQGRAARIELTLIDENLGPHALHVFHRSGGDGKAAWISGGYLIRDGSDWSWAVPDGLSGEVDIRLLATDLAGNRAADQRGPIRLPDSSVARSNDQPRVNLVNAPVSLDPPSPRSDDARLDSPRTARSERQPNTASPTSVWTSAASAATNGDPPLGDSPTLGTNARSRQLRDAARAHLERGRPRLALARIDDALEMSPEDVQLRSLRGLALLRAGDAAAARAELLTALGTAPNEIDALDGMVRLSAESGDLDASRAALEKLTRLQPDNARHWLDYGDMLFKSGQAAQAQAAWTAARDRAKPDDRLHARAVERLARFAATGAPASRPTR